MFESIVQQCQDTNRYVVLIFKVSLLSQCYHYQPAALVDNTNRGLDKSRYQDHGQLNPITANLTVIGDAADISCSNLFTLQKPGVILEVMTVNNQYS